MEKVEDILAERHKTHGYFMDVAATAVALKAVIRDRRPDLLPDQEEALNMICTKIARIVCGAPDTIDHWEDIAGYARLVVKLLKGETI